MGAGSIKGSVPLALAAILASTVLGFLMTVQFRSSAAISAREQATPSTAIQRLEDEQGDLKQQLARLRVQVTDLQRSASSGAAGVSSTAHNLEQQRLVAGLLAVRGPGLVVTLDDSTKPMAPGDDANDFLVHDYDLRDVVNLFWLAGAEAVSINGERVINTSSLYCVGSTILVNDTRLSPPYEIRAIGDAASLEQMARNTNYLRQLRAQVSKHGVQFRIVVGKDVSIPAYTGNLGVKLAQPGWPGNQVQAAERVRAEGN